MLFSDVEGSTRLAQELGAAWPAVLADHRRLLRDAITGAGGYIEVTEGDSFFATFADASSALSAALEGQRALRRHPWPEAVGELRVRMGLHTGFADHTDGHYVGLEVHRGARVAAAAGGGQVLLSDATKAAIARSVEAEDLGWHRLKDFPDPIRLYHLLVDRDRPASAFPPPKTLDIRSTNLPPTDRPLVGRTAEQKMIVEAFLEDDARLVTLTGLGGVGKTTLALAVARSLLDAYTGGVWLVRAEALASRDELLQAVGAAIRVRDVPGVDLIHAIADRLETGRHLLVLDNLEHLTDGPLAVADLLKCAPGVAVLATSRAPLRLESERAITLGPMQDDEAVSMFAARAAAVDPSLTLDDPETLAAVEELCRRLGFLPLALELAASRLRLMSPRQLLDRLGSALDLKGTEADRPERQRSVRATIEWTLGLLPDDAARLFTRLGVFSGIPSLDVIEMVCGEDIDVLEAAAALVDYSLLRRAGPGLELIEALREVAVERLEASKETEEIRRAHAEAMIILGRGVRSSATAPKATLEQMDSLLADTWAAARWTRASDPHMHAALVANLSPWWAWRGALRGAIDEIEAALGATDLQPPGRGELLINRAHLLLLAGRNSDALRDAEEAMPSLGDRSDLDRAGDLHVLAWAQMFAGRPDDAVETGRAALECSRRSGARERVVSSLLNLAQSLMQSGSSTDAGPLLDEAEMLSEALETASALGMWNIRGDWCLLIGDPARALEGFARSLAYSHGIIGHVTYDMAGIAVALEQLGENEYALEVATALAIAVEDWGAPLEIMSQFEGGVPAAMDRARRALSAERAQAAESRGRAVEADARASHALGVARDVLASRDVSERR